MRIFLNETSVSNCLISKLMSCVAIPMAALPLAVNREIFCPLVSLVLNLAIFRNMSLILYVTDFVTLKVSNSSDEDDSLNPWLKTNPHPALAGVAQGAGHHPANQKAASWTPSPGTGLGCGLGAWLGVCEGQLMDVSVTHQCFSPSFSPSLSLFLKINEIF